MYGAFELLAHMAHNFSLTTHQQAHAARLVALMAQSIPTHGLMESEGVIDTLLGVIDTLSQRWQLKQQQSAKPYIADEAVKYTGKGWLQLQLWQREQKEKQQLWQRQEDQVKSDASTAPRPDEIAVLKHAVSALSVLAQNPGMHFKLVGAGAIPALVGLLEKGV